MPIFKAKKLILAGDPLQLPPTILSLKQRERKKEKQKKATASKSKKPTSKETSKTGKKTDPERKNSPSEEDDDGTGSDAEEEIEKELEETSPQSNTSRPVELRPPRTLETTLFDRLETMYGTSIKRLLQVQYR